MASRLKLLIATIILTASSTTVAFKIEDKVIFKKQQAILTSDKVVKKIKIEIAETEQQHEHGLMFRNKLNTNTGMLFIFKDEDVRQFWMKNTIINLSIGYFDKNKKLIDIQEMKAVTSVLQTNIPTYPSKGPAQYALEMSEGWFTKNNIKLGAIIKL